MSRVGGKKKKSNSHGPYHHTYSNCAGRQCLSCRYYGCRRRVDITKLKSYNPPKPKIEVKSTPQIEKVSMTKFDKFFLIYSLGVLTYLLIFLLGDALGFISYIPESIRLIIWIIAMGLELIFTLVALISKK